MKDVQDFFRDSGIGAKGYTIVEQGKVAEIVSAKAEERRILIEEAAGITKYKARRREAESKIKSTEQNLVRVKDVLRRDQPADQFARAPGEEGRALQAAARDAAHPRAVARGRRAQRISSSSVGEAKGRMVQLKDAVTALSTQLAERELAVQEKRIALAEAEKAVSRGAEQLYALRSEIKNLEGQIELSRREWLLGKYFGVLRTASTKGVLNVEREIATLVEEVETLQGALTSHRLSDRDGRDLHLLPVPGPCPARRHRCIEPSSGSTPSTSSTSWRTSPMRRTDRCPRDGRESGPDPSRRLSPPRRLPARRLRRRAHRRPAAAGLRGVRQPRACPSGP